MTTPEKHDKAPLHKYLDAEGALERIRKIDLAYFLAQPGATEYMRDIIPGEFEDSNRAAINNGHRLQEPMSGYKWMVRVSAYRDPTDGRVIMRVREAVLAPIGE
jgi:hypothetical protein